MGGSTSCTWDLAPSPGDYSGMFMKALKQGYACWGQW